MSLTGRAQVSQPSLDGFAGRWRAPAVSNLSPSKQPDPNVGRLAGTLPQGLSTGLLSGGTGRPGIPAGSYDHLVAGVPHGGGGLISGGFDTWMQRAHGGAGDGVSGNPRLAGAINRKHQGDTGTPAWRQPRRQPPAEARPVTPAAPAAPTGGLLARAGDLLASLKQQAAAKQAAQDRAKPFDVYGQSVSPYGGWQL